MDKKSMTFMAACKDFFGLLPDQKPMDFGKDLKKLTPKDREEITKGLEQNGYVIVAATV